MNITPARSVSAVIRAAGEGSLWYWMECPAFIPKEDPEWYESQWHPVTDIPELHDRDLLVDALRRGVLGVLRD